MSETAPTKPPLNPYESALATPEIITAEFAVAAPPWQRPRVWTAFTAIATAFAAMIVANIVAVIVLVVVLIVGGKSPAELQQPLLDIVMSPRGFILVGLPTQRSLAAVALAAAWLSPQPLALRLGFVRPTWPWWKVLVVIVGTLVPFAIGMGGAVALAEVLEPDPTAEMLMKTMTPAWIVPYLLFISLAPGFAEEMLFRGYVQRRLIERWGGWTAVLVTSAIFAVIHIAPHTVVFAFPVGIWLGLMAWKSGSIWPGVIAHAAVNGLWNVFNIGQQFEVIPEEPSWVFLATLGAVGVVAFAWSLVIMRQSTPAEPDGPEVHPTDSPATGAAPAP
jgi:membrane protease YdiL (CAAX protease family)